MANQRAAGIINVSFTMPQSMADLLENRARMEMTNRSEIVRRAIMAYLSPEERQRIQESLIESREIRETAKAAEPVAQYQVKKPRKKADT